jgi:Rps23 Pro-64 3,4-dihydroxylase Tpa1-like proline 4-hydroxylase
MSIVSSQLSTDRDLVDLASFERSIEQLRNHSESFRQTYASGKPFPHLVVDDLFTPEILDRVVAEFPKSGDRDWIVWDTTNELKTTSRGINGLSTFTQLFCLWLNSAEFIAEIERITGIENLVADPLFHGAGLHEMYPGGWLDIHADYTQHLTLPLIRRLNLLIYLNRDWDADWGGEIELREKKNEANRVAYPPYFNRTLIFPTTPETLHGAPRRLSCPAGSSRKLLSIYYWTPVPIPSFLKMGTPHVVWAASQKRKLKGFLNRVAGKD